MTIADIAARQSFSDRAKPFMMLDCHLIRCVFPACIGKSGICNDRAEAFATFFAEHDRQISDLTAALEEAEARADALMESQYRAGMKAGWNFCVRDDEDGYQRAMEYQGHLRALAKEPSP